MKKTEYVAEKSMKISLTKIKKPYFALESDSGGFHQGFFQLKLTKPILIKLVVGLLYLNPT
jgi:hypothetical protein